MTVEPMTEAEALDAVRQQNAETPGLLTYYPCPVSNAYHLTLAEARAPDRRPVPGPEAK
jgi:hypothetical protein